MKRPRPCGCDQNLPARERCSKKWARCTEGMQYFVEELEAAALKKEKP